MGQKTRTQVKERFQDGDRPDQNDFIDLIDSAIWNGDYNFGLLSPDTKLAEGLSSNWSFSEGNRFISAGQAGDVSVAVTNNESSFEHITIAFQQDATGSRTLTVTGLTLTGAAVRSGVIQVNPEPNEWTLVRIHKLSGSTWYVSTSASLSRSKTVDPAGSGITWALGREAEGERLELQNADEDVVVTLDPQVAAKTGVIAFEQQSTSRGLQLIAPSGGSFVGAAIDGSGNVDVDTRDGEWTLIFLNRINANIWHVSSSDSAHFPLAPAATF